MIERICKTCGKKFRIYPSRIRKRNWGNFCSPKCRPQTYKKDSTPWNKNTKGICKSNSGSFKKGQISWSKGKKFPHLSGKNAYHWNGGKFKDRTNSYIFIHKPTHPFANIHGYIREQRLVVEKYLKRYLAKEEVVHHINEIRDDNRIKNLMVFKNGIYHFWFHKKGSCNPKGIIFDGCKIR